MAGHVYKWAIRQAAATPAAKAVLLALAWYSDDEGENARPGADLLSVHTGLSVRSIRRALQSLESQNLIECDGYAYNQNQKLRAKKYRINCNAEPVTVSRSQENAEPVTVSRSKAERAIVSRSNSAERAIASPNYKTLTDHSISNESARGDLIEALATWAKVKGVGGVVLPPNDERKIRQWCDEFGIETVNEVLADLLDLGHARPKLFWVGERCEYKKRQKAKSKQRQRKNAGSNQNIENAWRARQGGSASSSLVDRLKSETKK